jgi:hypothetical protein
MTAIAARIAEAFPKSNAKHGINVRPLTGVIVGDVGPTLLVLLGAVGFVLLIACANVANLLLTRSIGRRKEMAICAAMGASRVRVLVQLLSESVVLSLAAVAVGLLLAVWVRRRWSPPFLVAFRESIPSAWMDGCLRSPWASR